MLSNPTHSPPLRHIPHNALMRPALPSAVIRAGVVFNPDSFSCLIFDPVRYSHLPSYPSYSSISPIAPNCPQNLTMEHLPVHPIKTTHKLTHILTSGNKHEAVSTSHLHLVSLLTEINLFDLFNGSIASSFKPIHSCE